MVRPRLRDATSIPDGAAEADIALSGNVEKYCEIGTYPFFNCLTFEYIACRTILGQESQVQQRSAFTILFNCISGANVVL